jgi:hypothetical protein
MKEELFVPKGAHFKAALAVAIFLLAVALAVLVRAFFLGTLTPDERILLNVFQALLFSGLGFILGGLAITVTSPLPHFKIAIRAAGAGAGLVLAVLHPLYPAVGSSPVSGLAIASPAPGSTVGQTVEVSGFTPYARWNTYLLAGSAEGGDTIQDEILRVSSSGRFSGYATLGSATVGAGLQYRIRVLATKRVLQPGPWVGASDDVVSGAVVVNRAGSGS